MEPVFKLKFFVCFAGNFYPQAPHGACRLLVPVTVAVYTISILRLRMEPVIDGILLQSVQDISILRLRMEPVIVRCFVCTTHFYFYPQAPHGACRTGFSIRVPYGYFYPQAPHGACRLHFGQATKYPKFLSSGSAWSLSNPSSFISSTSSHFYPQAPHGACLIKLFVRFLSMIFLSSGSAWSLSRMQTRLYSRLRISILRLRMEPV